MLWLYSAPLVFLETSSFKLYGHSISPSTCTYYEIQLYITFPFGCRNDVWKGWPRALNTVVMKVYETLKGKFRKESLLFQVQLQPTPSNIPVSHNVLPSNLFSWALCSKFKVTHKNMICTFTVSTESCRLDCCTYCHCHNKLAHLCEEPGLRSVTCCNINRCNLPFDSINLSLSFVEITSVIKNTDSLFEVGTFPKLNIIQIILSVAFIQTSQCCAVRRYLLNAISCFTPLMSVFRDFEGVWLGFKFQFLETIGDCSVYNRKMAYTWTLQFSEHSCALDLECTSQE